MQAFCPMHTEGGKHLLERQTFAGDGFASKRCHIHTNKFIGRHAKSKPLLSSIAMYVSDATTGTGRIWVSLKR